MKITHTKSNVVQYNEYYPLGLQASTSWTRENSSNNFLYNEGSELNQTTGWYETAFRNYDAALGRLTSIDPMASKYASLSGYHYAYNNPVMSNDPNGAEPESDAERQFNYMLQMERLQRELDDRSRADFLKSNPFYDGPFDPGMAAAYYGMQAEMESQRQAMLLTNAQRGDMNSIREYAAMHDGLIHYEGAEAKALFINLYAMEATKFRRRVPGAPTPSGGAQQEPFGFGREDLSNSFYTERGDYIKMKNLLAEFLSGDGPERSLFWDSHPLTRAVRQSAVVRRAREFYSEKHPNGGDMVRQHFDFYVTDIPFVNSDIEQFIGSARVSIYPTTAGTLFVVDNTTGRFSGGFDSVSDIPRIPGQTTPMGNIYQRFIWFEEN